VFKNPERKMHFVPSNYLVDFELGVFRTSPTGQLQPLTDVPIWLVALDQQQSNVMLEYFRRKKVRRVTMPIDALRSRATLARFFFSKNIAGFSTPYEFELIRAYLIASMAIARSQS